MLKQLWSSWYSWVSRRCAIRWEKKVSGPADGEVHPAYTLTTRTSPPAPGGLRTLEKRVVIWRPPSADGGSEAAIDADIHTCAECLDREDARRIPPVVLVRER